MRELGVDRALQARGLAVADEPDQDVGEVREHAVDAGGERRRSCSPTVLIVYGCTSRQLACAVLTQLALMLAPKLGPRPTA